MQLIEINWHPSDRVLRQFGLCAAIALPVLAWWLTTETRIWSLVSGSAPWQLDAGNLTAVGSALVAGLVLGSLGFIRPRWLRLPFLAATLITLPIGLVVSQLLVALMFYGIFLPVGLLFKLIGRDALDRRFDPQAGSYWQLKPQATSMESYFRQS